MARRKHHSRRARAYGDKRPFTGKQILGKLGGKVKPRSTRSSFVYAKGNTVYEAKASKRTYKGIAKKPKGTGKRGTPKKNLFARKPMRKPARKATGARRRMPKRNAHGRFMKKR